MAKKALFVFTFFSFVLLFYFIKANIIEARELFDTVKDEDFEDN